MSKKETILEDSYEIKYEFDEDEDEFDEESGDEYYEDEDEYDEDEEETEFEEDEDEDDEYEEEYLDDDDEYIDEEEVEGSYIVHHGEYATDEDGPREGESEEDFITRIRLEKERELTVELERKKKEIELQKEIEKAKELKRQKRLKTERNSIIVASTIILLFVTSIFINYNIVKPSQHKNEVLYLYDLTTNNIELDRKAILPYIAILDKTVEKGLDEEKATEEFLKTTDIEETYEVVNEGMELIYDVIAENDDLKTKRIKKMHEALLEYIESLNNLNNLLLEIGEMPYVEFKENYSILIQDTMDKKIILDEIVNDTNIFGV